MHFLACCEPLAGGGVFWIAECCFPDSKKDKETCIAAPQKS
jgi:hypothetical protein